MRISRASRDTLAAIADARGVSLDEALQKVLFEYQARADFDRLANEDPESMAEYLAEARTWAEVDVEVVE
ncbi:hypothetical protein GCM10023223_20940 [Stackebrandtia albiflava]